MEFIDLSEPNQNEQFSATTISTEKTSTEAENHLQKGGFFFGPSNDPKVLKAAREKKFEVVDFFLNEDIVSNLSIQDELGNTLLHYLVLNYSENDIAKKLTKKLLSRSDLSHFIDIQNKQGDTPLLVGVSNEEDSLCDILIDRGADKKIKNAQGYHVSENSQSDPVLSDLLSHKKSDKDIFSLINIEPDTKIDNQLPPILMQLLNKSMNNESDLQPIDIRLTESYAPQVPGSPVMIHATENAVESDTLTQDLIDELKRSYIDNLVQDGGAKKKTDNVKSTNNNKIAVGQRRMNTYNENDTMLRRAHQSQTTMIHDSTIEQIMEVMKVDRDEARYIKAAIYRKIKDEMPELGGLDRALEMKKRANEEYIKSLGNKYINEVKGAITKYYEEKTKDDKKKDDKKKDDKKKDDKKKDDKKKDDKKKDDKKKTEQQNQKGGFIKSEELDEYLDSMSSLTHVTLSEDKKKTEQQNQLGGFIGSEELDEYLDSMSSFTHITLSEV